MDGPETGPNPVVSGFRYLPRYGSRITKPYLEVTCHLVLPASHILILLPTYLDCLS